MQNYLEKNNRLASYFAVAYFGLTFYWVLAFWLNHDHSAVHDYISDLFVASNPYSWLFRILEVISGMVLCLAVYFSKTLYNVSKSSLILIKRSFMAIGIMIIFDGIVISNCTKSEILCGGTYLQDTLSILHALESIIVASLMIWLGYYIYKKSTNYLKFFAVIFIILALGGLYHCYNFGDGPINGVVQRVFGFVFGVLVLLVFLNFSHKSTKKIP